MSEHHHPNSVTSIGNYAFHSCSGLTSVTIPSSVTSIGNSTFYGCSGLTSVTIPSSVTSIGNSAFYGCSGLTSVTIPNSVTSIGNSAFFSCKSMISIEIPEGVTSIGTSAFSSCSGLTSVTIPNSVTSIGNSAFHGCTGLTSITIPNNVTSIGESAFGGCTSMTSVTIESNAFVSTSSTCYNTIFGNQVTNYIIGDEVTSIGNYAFRGCTGLKSITIPNSVTSIGHDAFNGCSGLTSITIPNSLTSIGGYGFNGCTGLTKVIISNIAAWCDIYFGGDLANPLLYAKHLYSDEETEITNLVIPDGVTSIGNYAFHGCSGLKSITIPNSVSSIGNSAFYNCSGLTSISIPNSVASIGSSSFYGCSGLTSATIGNSVTSIGNSAFSGCSGLTSVTIGKSVTSIGESAFYKCSSLTSIEIPNGVKSIEYKTFQSCRSITSITIPNSVTSIGNYAFHGCSPTSVTIPNSVTSIGTHAFEYCGGMKYIIIGSGVTSIGDYALSGIASLSDVYCYAENVPTSNTNIFYNTTCSKLHVPASSMEAYMTTKPWSDFRNVYVITYYIDGIYYNLSGTDATVISGGYKYSGNVIIPSSISYDGKTYNVTSIESSAFTNCTGLTAVTIPNSVTSIGEGAFKGCTAMTTVTINNDALVSANRSYNSTLETIFGSQVKNYILGDEVTSIGKYAFWDCSDLTSVTIPNSVTSIGASAFYNCSGLTSIEIPSSVMSIAGSAFNSCSGLTSIVVVDGNTMYDSRDGCNAIIETSSNTLIRGCQNTVIPSGVITIGTYAFSNCTGLISIEIPSSVTTIGEISFRFCTGLLDVYCYSESVPNADPTGFDYSNIANATLHVPASSVEAYKATKPWSDFSKIGKIKMPEYTITYYVDGNKYKSYKIEKGVSITPEAEPTKEGYTFSGWSEIPETMPAHDVIVTGTFIVNKYKLTYTVDGEVYKSINVEYGSRIIPEAEPTKEFYTFSGWSEIPKTMPAHDVTVAGKFNINKYKLNYIIDDTVYKSFDVEYGASITPEAEPTKEGYTFSGWSELPETMPSHNVIVMGTFTINQYTVNYEISGFVYETQSFYYGATITYPDVPIIEGYTFTWGDAPEKMPARDLTIKGFYEVNTYNAIFLINGNVYSIIKVTYGSSITPPEVQELEGYSFAWSEIPEKMPATDVTITGTFSVNSYTITYIVDGEVYKKATINYGTEVTTEVAPEKEGYTFSGWSEIPKTMPAKDVVVTGTFTVNSYNVTFKYDDTVLTIKEVEYGSEIPLPESLDSDRYTLVEWLDVPDTMPAHDITILANFTDGVKSIKNGQKDGDCYLLNGVKVNKLHKGVNIIRNADGTNRKVLIK